MEKSEPFTEVVNYRILASHLRQLGFARIPKLEKILEKVRQIKNVELVEWVGSKAKADSEEFISILEFHMNLIEQE